MKPSAVVMMHWYSFFESSLATFKLWHYLLRFLDHRDTEGEKARDLLALLSNNEDRQSLYVKLLFIIDVLRPVHEIQKLLESGEPLLHRMYHIVDVNLQSEMTKYSGDFILSDEVTSVITILPLNQAEVLRADFKGFGCSLSDKWQATYHCNLSPAISGPSALWKQVMILDPFLKHT